MLSKTEWRLPLRNSTLSFYSCQPQTQNNIKTSFRVLFNKFDPKDGYLLEITLKIEKISQGNAANLIVSYVRMAYEYIIWFVTVHWKPFLRVEKNSLVLNTEST